MGELVGKLSPDYKGCPNLGVLLYMRGKRLVKTLVFYCPCRAINNGQTLVIF